MKTELTVKQRLDLQSILPKEGDFTTVKMLRVLREELSFSEEEHELLKFKFFQNGSVEWNKDAAKDCIKEINIPQVIVDEVKKILEKLNIQKKITESHLDFYELFMCDEKDEDEIAEPEMDKALDV